MAELQKVKRTLGKHDPRAPHETLLVVDATTGSNALNQAREFKNAIGLTGLIVTKLDGSGKGGIVVAIQDELGIPTRFVGTGERLDDFALLDVGAGVGLGIMSGGRILKGRSGLAGEISARDGRISTQSPIGSALMDRRVGEVVEVQTPMGPHSYRIEKIDRR